MNDYDAYDAKTGEGYCEYELHSMFEEWIDESYGTVYVAGNEYDTSRIMREVSPIDYRCAYCDWLDSETANGRLTLEPPEDDDEEDDE